jgi:hypothetical protein
MFYLFVSSKVDSCCVRNISLLLEVTIPKMRSPPGPGTIRIAPFHTRLNITCYRPVYTPLSPYIYLCLWDFTRGSKSTNDQLFHTTTTTYKSYIQATRNFFSCCVQCCSDNLGNYYSAVGIAEPLVPR